MGREENAWGGAEHFLRSAVHAIDTPVVGKEGNASQAADCVYEEESPILMTKVSKTSQVLVNAGATVSLYAEKVMDDQRLPKSSNVSTDLTMIAVKQKSSAGAEFWVHEMCRRHERPVSIVWKALKHREYPS